jgi:hypothetical protein
MIIPRHRDQAAARAEHPLHRHQRTQRPGNAAVRTDALFSAWCTGAITVSGGTTMCRTITSGTASAAAGPADVERNTPAAGSGAQAHRTPPDRAKAISRI